MGKARGTSEEEKQEMNISPILFYLFYLCVYIYTMQLCACGDQRPTRKSWFSPSIMWILGIQCSPSDLLNTFYRWRHIPVSSSPSSQKNETISLHKGTASISRTPNLPSLLHCRAPECTTSGQVPKHQQEVPTTACGQAGRGD